MTCYFGCCFRSWCVYRVDDAFLDRYHRLIFEDNHPEVGHSQTLTIGTIMMDHLFSESEDGTACPPPPFIQPTSVGRPCGAEHACLHCHGRICGSQVIKAFVQAHKVAKVSAASPQHRTLLPWRSSLLLITHPSSLWRMPSITTTHH